MSAQISAAHCNSYYAASANTIADYPLLEGAHSCDVCIVGGGFTGISSALYLAERGYKVTVVEANRIAWGASGRNGGQLIGGISGEARLGKYQQQDNSELLWNMRWAGNDIVKQRVEQYNIDCDLKFGYMDVAIKARHKRALQEEYELLQRHDFPHQTRLVMADEIGDVLGTKAYIAGLINMANGHLHPFNLCIGEAMAAVQQGASIFERSAVSRIEHGRKVKVYTEKGLVESEFVILAGNAYHALEQKHLGGVVFPAGSFIIATEPLSDELAKSINPLDLAVCDPNYVLDYFRLSADKRLLFGGRCNYSGREPASIKKTMLPRMLKIFPQLKDVKIEYEWGGKIGIVINRIPHIGRIDNNIFYAQGYSGHGVNVTHLAGQVLADAICGTFERFDVFARARHFRIPGSQWLGNNLVALGMIYFRLMDMR